MGGYQAGIILSAHRLDTGGIFERYAERPQLPQRKLAMRWMKHKARTDAWAKALTATAIGGTGSVQAVGMLASANLGVTNRSAFGAAAPRPAIRPDHMAQDYAAIVMAGGYGITEQQLRQAGVDI